MLSTDIQLADTASSDPQRSYITAYLSTGPEGLCIDLRCIADPHYAVASVAVEYRGDALIVELYDLTTQDHPVHTIRLLERVRTALPTDLQETNRVSRLKS